MGVLRAETATRVLLCLMFLPMANGCSSRDGSPEGSGSRPAADRTMHSDLKGIENIRVGMTADEAAEALKSNRRLLLSVPLMYYVTESGYYWFRFKNSKLVEAIYYPRREPVDKKGIYVLPRKRRGQPFDEPRLEEIEPYSGKPTH